MGLEDDRSQKPRQRFRSLEANKPVCGGGAFRNMDRAKETARQRLSMPVTQALQSELG